MGFIYTYIIHIYIHTISIVYDVLFSHPSGSTDHGFGVCLGPTCRGVVSQIMGCQSKTGLKDSNSKGQVLYMYIYTHI